MSLHGWSSKARRDETPQNRQGDWIERLCKPSSISDFGPISGRFIYSLRLIALHRQVGRDPVPELAVKLGGVEIAIQTLKLAENIERSWPESIRVRRFCCRQLSYDEATIACMIAAAAEQRREGFEDQISGLIRHDRIERMWMDSIELVCAELASA